MLCTIFRNVLAVFNNIVLYVEYVWSFIMLDHKYVGSYWIMNNQTLHAVPEQTETILIQGL